MMNELADLPVTADDTDDGLVRRTDLYLRAEFVDLETTIYRITANKYVIFCANEAVDFEALQLKFSRSIKPVTLLVDLVQEEPSAHAAIVPKIGDQDIAKNFEGFSLSAIALQSLLLGKFPHLPIYRVDDEQRKVFIRLQYRNEQTDMGVTLKYLSKKDRDLLTIFLNKLRLGIAFEIVEDFENLNEPATALESQGKASLLMSQQLLRPKTPYGQRDEALWYDNVEKIYEGTFNRSAIYFQEPDDFACYADYSVFENINIRNLLLLYKTVFITPPIEKDLSAWLKDQKIYAKDFFDLIAAGRIKFLLPQQENRYDPRLIQQAYEARPGAVVTSKALALLELSDIVDMADRHIFNQLPDLLAIRAYSEAVAAILPGIDANDYYDLLVWPIKAKRRAFDVLQFGSVLHTATFGINNALEPGISRRLNRDLSFEFTVHAQNIHLSHALNATYFPYRSTDGYSDYHYANMMGGFLNMVRLSTEERLKAGELQQANLLRTPAIHPIDLLEIDTFVPMDEFEHIMKNARAYPKSKFLMEYLANLDEEKRLAKIVSYNQSVREVIRRRPGKALTLDLVTNVAVDTVSAFIPIPGLGTTLSLLKAGKRLAPGVQKTTEQLEEAFYKGPDKANIHFLAQINRVARLK